jgi:hypothetical protein
MILMGRDGHADPAASAALPSAATTKLAAIASREKKRCAMAGPPDGHQAVRIARATPPAPVAGTVDDPQNNERR